MRSKSPSKDGKADSSKSKLPPEEKKLVTLVSFLNHGSIAPEIGRA